MGCTSVCAICDNYISEHRYRGIPIIKIEDCIKKYPSAKWIISSQLYSKEMQNQLQVRGVLQQNILEYRIRTSEYMKVLQKELYNKEVECLISQALGKTCEDYIEAVDKIKSLSEVEKGKLEKVYNLSQWL